MNFFLVFIFFGFVSCKATPQKNFPAKAYSLIPNRVLHEDSIVKGKLSDTTHFTLKDFYGASIHLHNKVETIYKSLTTKEKAAQLIMPATSEYYKIGIPFQEIKRAMLNRQIGGVLYLKGTKKTFTKWIAELKRISADSILPLISSCDCEPTLYHKKFKDADSVTATNLMVNDRLIDQGAVRISNEIKAIGIQLNFAPVADIGINQAVINTRSFSANPNEIVNRASRFVFTSQNANIATTIKHFPGHGAIIGDSHKQTVSIDGTLTEENTFKRIINEANPVAVMVGHINIKNNSQYQANIPATLSPQIIKGLLKNKIAFKGIVVTDAMNMAAVRNIPNASWKALVAGADLIIMPLNIGPLHRQIVNEFNNKKSDLAAQFEASVKKIIRLKICTGVIR